MNDSRGNRDRVRTISFYAVLAVGTYLLWLVTAPFILPLCAAAVLVVFFYPLHERWERRFGASPAALASTLVVTTLLIVPTILVLTAFVREASAAVSNVQHAVAAEGVASFGRWWEWLEQRAPLAGRYRVTDLVTDSGRAMAGAAASAAGGTLRNVGAFLFDLIVVIFAMFFLFRDARAIMSAVRRVLPFEEEHRERVIAQAHDLIRASVIASMAVASAQGAAGGLLFWAVGIGAPVFWGVLMAFLSLLPVAGAWLVWLPAAIWFLSTGAIAKGVLLIALGDRCRRADRQRAAPGVACRPRADERPPRARQPARRPRCVRPDRDRDRPGDRGNDDEPGAGVHDARTARGGGRFEIGVGMNLRGCQRARETVESNRS
jgi:predicted PurR-regulated permease PerM